jgi:putative Ca2+/H+ antiporter (TMEM165/GDT1 family)
MEFFSPFLETFFLVFLAEFGDKSQLVAMTLAVRYRPMPIVIASVAAFAVLNFFGVVFGAMAAQWLPVWLVAAVVALLFFVFGFQSFRIDEDVAAGVDAKIGKRLLLSVFLLMFMAEFGDKTQLAVAAMGGINSFWPVWSGATVALALTTLLGVVVGKKLLNYISFAWVHRGAGVLFVVFGCVALYEAITQFVLINGEV